MTSGRRPTAPGADGRTGLLRSEGPAPGVREPHLPGDGEGEGEVSVHYLGVIRDQYKGARDEILASLQTQQSSLSFGGATLGLLVAGGAQVWKEQRVLAALLFGIIAPAVSAFVATIFLTEQMRLLRAGSFCVRLEAEVEHLFSVRLPLWEHWLVRDCPRHPNVERVQSVAVLSVAALVTAASTATGIYRSLGLSMPGGMHILFVAGAVTVVVVGVVVVAVQLRALRELRREREAIVNGRAPVTRWPARCERTAR